MKQRIKNKRMTPRKRVIEKLVVAEQNKKIPPTVEA
jgi:hypothetical protein